MFCEDGLFRIHAPPVLSCLLIGRLHLPKRDRRLPQIGVWNGPVPSARVLHIDPRQVTGIVLDQERLLQPSRPWAEHIVPVTNVVKVNAVSTNLSRDGRKEAEKKLRFVEGIAWWCGCLSIRLPGRKRSLPESGMDREMVNGGDLEREPAFEFGQCQQGTLFGGIGALLADIRKCCAWQ